MNKCQQPNENANHQIQSFLFILLLTSEAFLKRGMYLPSLPTSSFFRIPNDFIVQRAMQCILCIMEKVLKKINKCWLFPSLLGLDMFNVSSWFGLCQRPGR
uniref:Uncharacterized protein n=1 Tax=Cacopsylla melanoneura TaxID=428564 RepID=A0A8D9BUE8_9HEMI